MAKKVGILPPSGVDKVLPPFFPEEDEGGGGECLCHEPQRGRSTHVSREKGPGCKNEFKKQEHKQDTSEENALKVRIGTGMSTLPNFFMFSETGSHSKGQLMSGTKFGGINCLRKRDKAYILYLCDIIWSSSYQDLFYPLLEYIIRFCHPHRFI